MRGLVLANTLVYRTPQTLDQVLLVAGILIIEPLVLWFLTNKVRFPKLILVSLTANIASSVVGTIVGGFTIFGTSMGPYLPFLLLIPPINLANLLGNSIFLLVAFLLSVLIEWRVYKPFKIPNALKTAFRANLASYLLIIIYIVSLSVWFPEEYISPLVYTEAKRIVGTMNRSQQGYWFEHGVFANSIEKLEVNIDAEESNYSYSIRVDEMAVFHYGTSKKEDPRSTSVVGGVFLVPNEDGQLITVSILCEKSGSSTQLPEPTLNKNGQPLCAEGTDKI